MDHEYRFKERGDGSGKIFEQFLGTITMKWTLFSILTPLEID